ncbi:MAG: hypothetical protein LC138_00205 [Anaerolineales bacterium]|nr:hypothetical protein [Anaerolineales bacterium]GIK10216.1 MAG: hypothetical protein BroJett001_22820 [Chloroflexota bacterium]
MPPLSKSARKVILVFTAALTLLSGPACALTLFKWPDLSNGTPEPPTPVIPTATPLPQTQIVFHAGLPAPLLPGERLVLRVLDEVSGLEFNAADHPMQARDALNYAVALPLAVNSVTKYRYVRVGAGQLSEMNAFNQPVRYRMYLAGNPDETTDLIAAWPDQPFNGASGSVQGVAMNAENGAPIPSLFVTAAGVSAVADSAGRFSLHGLPAGTHNVVGYALDGGYTTFQQGATVAQGLATPVEIRVRPAALVPVIFTVHVPSGTQPGAPLRIAGNFLQLGAVFADLRGGSSVIANRMPVMNHVAEGLYSLTLSLPAGADVRYKYTLGDGYWNAERGSDGGFVTRQLIVPPNGAAIEEIVASWKAGVSAPVSFEVTAPSNTPAGDILYIQFGAPNWTEPIPMWWAGNNVWKYRLYGPMDLRSIHYRYCRNGQCGTADDEATAGETASGRQFSTAITAQDLRNTVTRWAWMSASGPSSLTGSNVVARGGAFMAGVEFEAQFHPSWIPSLPETMKNVQDIGSNWVILAPTWTYASSNPIVFGARPGADALWADAALMASMGRAHNLNVAFFPQPRFADSAAGFWLNSPRDPTWWQIWFDAYRNFAVNYADLAAQAGAQSLILGGDWVAPALPNGLVNGNPSGVPADAETRWLAILNEVRAHFRGQILWALPYTPPNLTTPAFLAQTDGVYLLISGNLSENSRPPREELEAAAASMLDNNVAPLQSMLGKPVYLAFGYPSINGSGANCLPANFSGCLDWTALNQPTTDRPELSLNLQLQADIYETLLAAVNTRPWVSGVVSRGYYPPTLLQDKSASIHGKPAGDVLWYWYQRFLGIVK